MYDTYIIKENDTLDSIEKKFNTTKNILDNINNYNLNIIPGTSILVPTINNEYFDYYTITKGDTLYKIANDNNISPKLLAELNGLNETDYIYPNQILLVPKGGTIMYITANGDTLNEIANGLKTNVDYLLSQNPNIYLQPEQLIVSKYV